jgi:hypothetical protein
LFGFLVCVLVSTAFAAGGTLRALSASRTHALLPSFRVRALLAVALLVASIALSSHGLAVWFVLAGGPAGIGAEPAAFEATAVYVVGAVTAVFMFVLAMTANPNWAWLALPVILGFPSWMEVEGPRRLAAAGFSLPWIVGIAATLAWIAFAIWYLRARAIRPVLLLRSTHGMTELWRRHGDRQTKRWPANLTRAAATGILIGGRARRPLPQQFLIAGVVGVVLCLLLPLLEYLPAQQPATPPLTTFLFPFYPMFFVAVGAHQIVRQSRRVWLHVPGSRVQVFRLIELVMAMLYAVVLTCLTTLVLASILLRQTPLDEAVWGFALMASAALYSACMCLAAVRTVWFIAVGMVVAFAVQLVGLEVIGKPPSDAQLATVVGLQLAGAGVFRLVAELRWRSIDWLRFRPMRLGRNEIHWGTRG